MYINLETRKLYDYWNALQNLRNEFSKCFRLRRILKIEIYGRKFK